MNLQETENSKTVSSLNVSSKINSNIVYFEYEPICFVFQTLMVFTVLIVIHSWFFGTIGAHTLIVK